MISRTALATFVVVLTGCPALWAGTYPGARPTLAEAASAQAAGRPLRVNSDYIVDPVGNYRLVVNANWPQLNTTPPSAMSPSSFACNVLVPGEVVNMSLPSNVEESILPADGCSGTVTSISRVRTGGPTVLAVAGKYYLASGPFIYVSTNLHSWAFHMRVHKTNTVDTSVQIVGTIRSFDFMVSSNLFIDPRTPDTVQLVVQARENFTCPTPPTLPDGYTDNNVRATLFHMTMPVSSFVLGNAAYDPFDAGPFFNNPLLLNYETSPGVAANPPDGGRIARKAVPTGTNYCRSIPEPSCAVGNTIDNTAGPLSAPCRELRRYDSLTADQLTFPNAIQWYFSRVTNSAGETIYTNSYGGIPIASQHLLGDGFLFWDDLSSEGAQASKPWLMYVWQSNRTTNNAVSGNNVACTRMDSGRIVSSEVDGSRSNNYLFPIAFRYSTSGEPHLLRNGTTVLNGYMPVGNGHATRFACLATSTPSQWPGNPLGDGSYTYNGFAGEFGEVNGMGYTRSSGGVVGGLPCGNCPTSGPTTATCLTDSPFGAAGVAEAPAAFNLWPRSATAPLSQNSQQLPLKGRTYVLYSRNDWHASCYGMYYRVFDRTVSDPGDFRKCALDSWSTTDPSAGGKPPERALIRSANLTDVDAASFGDGQVFYFPAPDASGPGITATGSQGTRPYLVFTAKADGRVNKRFAFLKELNFKSDGGILELNDYAPTVCSKQNPYVFLVPWDLGVCQGQIVDWDFNNVVNIDDQQLYLNSWFARDPRCDVDGNGITVDDIFLWLNLWFQGCRPWQPATPNEWLPADWRQ